jgi:hypothetical protein
MEVFLDDRRPVFDRDLFEHHLPPLTADEVRLAPGGAHVLKGNWLLPKAPWHRSCPLNIDR